MQDAEELCRRILKIGDSIREASLLDETGSVLGRVTRDSVPSGYQPTPEALQKYGTWVTLVFSMARETDRIFGSTEYVTIAHKNFIHAAVPLPKNQGFAAMVLERSADVERIASMVQTVWVGQNSQSTRLRVEDRSAHKSRVGV